MLNRYSSRATCISCVALLLLAVPSAVRGQTQDLTPPVLADLAITPGVVNVEGADQTIRITAHITDNLSGFSFACLAVESPSSAQQHTRCFYDAWGRDSGTSLDGVYHVDINIPRSSETGTWRLRYLSLTDVVANNTVYFYQPLVDAGFTPTFDVVSAADSVAPVLADIAFVPAVVDVSGGGQTVRMNVRITDDSAGFSYSCFALHSPSFGQTRTACLYDAFHRDEGTNLDGLFHADIPMPQFSESGDWHFQYMTLTDLVGNTRVLFEQDFADSGFPATLHVDSVPDDVATAVVAGLQITPAAINTSDGPQTVTLTIRFTDNLSGFGFSCFAIQSPSAGQTHTRCLYPYQRDSGTDLDGTYHIDIEFPQYSEIGDWHILYLTATDAVGNTRVYFEPDLIAAGFQTTVQSIADSTPPALNVTLSPAALWPPNHHLVTISATIQASDETDPQPVIRLVSIASNEPDEGLGDGDTAGDIQLAAVGTDDRTFQLRAERSGHGASRIYTVTYSATDAAGNSTTAVATVTVADSHK